MLISGTTLAMTVMGVALAAILGYLFVRWCYRKDTEIEARRTAAMHVTSKLESYGLKRIPRITGKYAVGDYDGLAHEVKSFAELLLGDETVILKEFDDVFARVLDAKLKTGDGRTLLSAKLSDATAIEIKA